MSQTPPSDANPSVQPFVWAIFGAMALAAAYYLFVTRVIAPDPAPKPAAETAGTVPPTAAEGPKEPSSPWEVRGQFGDLFGGLNALFTGVTLAGLIYTLHLQRKSMAQQEHSLHLQQQALNASLQAIEEQSRIASEAAQLQALIAQLEQWNRMIDERVIREENVPSTKTTTDLIHQARILTNEIIEWRETHKIRVSTPAASTSPAPADNSTKGTSAQS